MGVAPEEARVRREQALDTKDSVHASARQHPPVLNQGTQLFFNADVALDYQAG